MRAFIFVFAALLVGACSSTEPPPPVGPTINPHCTRASTTPCDQPSHRMEACVCDHDDQCESGFCGLESKYCAHVCQWKPIAVALGDRCDCEDACETGTYCLEQCPTGAFCKNMGLESRCAPLGDIGSSCSYATGFSQCKSTLYCDRVTNTCAAYVIHGEGEGCGDFIGCAAGLYCRPQGGSAVCAPLKAAGETCSGAWECKEPYAACLPCSSGATDYCCTGTRVGAACKSSGECGLQGLYCSSLDGACHVIHAAGAACEPADSADACFHDVLTHYSTHCDPTTKTCVGGYCQ